jgi:hypothetical protein
MLNTSMQMDRREFQELLKEVQMYNKLDLVAQVIQTKYSKEIAGEDDEARRKDAAKTNELLEKILVAFTGTKSKSDASITKDKKDSSFSFKDDFKKFKDELKSGVAFGKRVAGSAVESFKSPIQTFKKGAIGAAKINEQIYQQAGDVFGTPADFTTKNDSIQKQPSAKQKIEAQGKAENPNIVDEPNEMVAEESKKQSFTFNELLDVTKESLNQLKAIKISLEGAPEPLKKGEPTPPVAAAPVASAEGDGGSGLLDMFGRPMGPAGGAAGKAAGGAAAGAGKVGLGAKIMGGLKAGGAMLGKGALAAGKVIGGAALAKPALIAAGVGLAAYGAYKGYKALTGGDDDQDNSVQSEVAAEQSEKTLIAGEEYVAGQPLSDKQMAVIGMAKSMGNTYSPAVEEQYAKQSQNIEGRETGGPMTAGKPYMVGESGPEVVVPTASAKVMPAQSKTIDLGGGETKKINPDGSYETRGAYGTKKYDKEGNLTAEISPRFAGYQKETGRSGAAVESLQQGAVSVSQSSQAGQVTGRSASAQVGQYVFETSGENASIRDMGQPSAQPVVMNNVSSNNQNTYIPVKGEPRATHRGSSLDQYSSRVASY